MDNNNLRRFFGAALTILGTLIILFAMIAYLQHGKLVLGMSIRNVGDAIIPFLVGGIFFGAGVSLVRQS